MRAKIALLMLLVVLFSATPMAPFPLYNVGARVAHAQIQLPVGLQISPTNATMYYGNVTVHLKYLYPPGYYLGSSPLSWKITPSTNAIKIKQLSNTSVQISTKQINAGTYIITFIAQYFSFQNSSLLSVQATANFTLKILPATFTLSASQQNITVPIYAHPRSVPTGNTQISIQAQSNTDPYQTITLSSNATWVSFASNPISPGQSVTVTLTPTYSGNYTVVITGKNNDNVTESIKLYVNAIYSTSNISIGGISLIPFANLITGALGSAVADLASYIGGPDGLYNLLMFLPAPNQPDGKPFFLWNAVIMPLYNKVLDVVLIFFVFVLFIAGLEWALENFNIMRPGTAISLLTGSAITLILFFLFPYLYAFVAEIFNDITYPANNMLVPNGALYAVLKGTISASPTAGLSGLVAIILGVVIFVLDMIVLLMVAIMGILRIFFIGALIVLMPLMLVLRLIPFTKHIAEEMISMLIGLMVSSLIVAIFFAFAYAVLGTGVSYFAQFGALATLIAGAMMPTVMAPRLGRVFETTAMMATGAVMTGTMAGVMAGTGAITGTIGGIQTIRGGGARALAAQRGWANSRLGQAMANLKIGGKQLGQTGVQKAAEVAAGGEIMGRNIIGGALSGIGSVFGMAPPMRGGVHMPLRGAGALAGKAGQAMQIDPTILTTVARGQEFQGVIDQHILNAYKEMKKDGINPNGPAPEGVDYHLRIKNMQDDEFIHFFNTNFGLNISPEQVPVAKKYLDGFTNAELYYLFEKPVKYSKDDLQNVVHNLNQTHQQLNEVRQNAGLTPISPPDWLVSGIVSSRKKYLHDKYNVTL